MTRARATGGSGRGRTRRLVGAAAVLLMVTGGVASQSRPALAAGTVMYAAVGGSGDCSSVTGACDLSTALAEVPAGGVIELVTSGNTARYVGNWTVSTSGTSASQPVTIEAAPGLASEPVLDGDGPDAPAGETCSTAPSAPCTGPVLAVPAGESVALSGITIADGNNTSTPGNRSAGGGGLQNGGTLTITGCAFIDNTAAEGGAIDNADGTNSSGTGSVTVTTSTFTGNTATFTGTNAFGWADGGAIDNGEFNGDGSVTVTGSTFTGNTALSDGGAIDNGDLGGSGSMTVTASTFTGNTAGYDGGAADNGDFGDSGSMTVTAATFAGNTAGSDGGAIDSGDGNRGSFGNTGGAVTVTASTFTGNTASVDGGTIDVGGSEEGDPGYGGSVAVAGDVFAGSCDQTGGSWTDGGYNAGSDSSCFGGPGAPTDVISSAGLGLSSLASNGGPTQTIAPAAGSAVIGIIPDPGTVTLGGSKVALCPAADQRGYDSAADSSCDAGAVQASGIAPGLSLADSAGAPAWYDQAGDTIHYRYKVTNTGPSPLSGITIADPAVPAANCPAPVLAPGTAETCTGSYTVTQADVTAGKVTDTTTTTAAAASVVGQTISSNSSSVTVQEGWPAILAGSFHPAAGGPEGYYVSATGNRWTVLITHPGTSKIGFTGHVTVPAGKLGNLTLINTPAGSQASIQGRALTFQTSNHGRVSGFSFTTSTKARSITLALEIGGQPAAAIQLYQGSTAAQASNGSPLTYTR